MSSLEAGTLIWNCLLTSALQSHSFQLPKYSPWETVLVHWKRRVCVDAGPLLDLGKVVASHLVSLTAVEFPERKVCNLFDIWQFSTLFRIFNSWKGISPGNLPQESCLLFILSPTVSSQLPAQLHLLPPFPSRSLVALPTQGLFVMKSFKMVSQSGENTCFWSVWWNAFPLRSNFSIFHFLHSPHYLSLPIISSPERLKVLHSPDWLNGAFLHVTHVRFASLLSTNSKEERFLLYRSQSR